MSKKMSPLKKKAFIYVLSFVVPVIVAILSFSNVGISIGGDNTVLIYDMRGEFVAYYGYLSDFGPGFDSLIHSMSGGLGGGFLGTVAMYLSPFDLFYMLVPLKFIPDAIYCLILLKIGLCGLFMSIYLVKCFGEKLSFLVVFVLSCSYALMSYMFAFCQLPMFFDSIVFLPLIALGAELIISGKKSPFFVIFMSLCMISNYYTAYMTVICLVIYFCFRLFEEDGEIRVKLKKFLSFAVQGVLSFGISSFLIIPVIYDLSKGKLNSDTASMSAILFKNNVADIFKMHLPSSYANLGGYQPPYIYCGIITFIFTLLWFAFGKNNIKSRIAGLLIFVFYYACFAIGFLDRVWHGFQDPIGFSARYSFTFVFFMIIFAARGFIALSGNPPKLSKSVMILLKTVFVVYTIFESYINSSYILSKLEEDYVFVIRKEYDRVCDVMTEGLSAVDLYDPSLYGRLAKNFNFSCYDGALFGYDGIDMYSSSYNEALVKLFGELGLNANSNYIFESSITPPVSSYFGVRYFLSYMKDYSAYYERIYDYKVYSLYENKEVLPFGFFINDAAAESPAELGRDPYQNINTLYSELYGNDVEGNVFLRQEYEPAFDLLEEGRLSFRFIPQRTGNYMFYRDFYYNETIDGYQNYLPSEVSRYGAFLNGEYKGEYGQITNRYCCDLGYAEIGEESILSLEFDPNAVEDLYLYYFDKDKYEEICSKVKGFEISDISSKGIELSGEADDDSYMIITLPYDNGYRIDIDGVKTDYSSYRNALLCVRVPKGAQNIKITYHPLGLKAGIVISLISLIFTVLYLRLNPEKIRKLIKRSPAKAAGAENRG